MESDKEVKITGQAEELTYDSVSSLGKWRSRREFKTVKKVRDRFEEMKQSRRNSCPFPSPFNIIDEIDFDAPSFRSASYSWEDLWESNWDQTLMKRLYIRGKSNIKSSMTFSPVEAAMAEYMNANVDVLISATEVDDEPKIEIIKNARRHLHNKGNFMAAKRGAFHDALIYGNAFEHITRVRKCRDIEKILANPNDAKKKLQDIYEGADEKGKEKIKKRLDSGKPLTEKEKIIEYDDIARIHVSLFEVYIDPDARCMRGFNYEATDLVWRTIPSIQQFRAEFEHSLDPFVIKENVKKVKSAEVAANTYDQSTPFFSVPSDLADKANNVEVIRYYNKNTDKFIIVANDIIIRDGPLPFNHKQIPFVHHRYFEVEHCFYGLGLPYFLEGLQSEDEALRNILLQQMKFNLAPPILVNKDIFNDADSKMDYWEPGKVIDFSGPVGQENIRWFEGSQSRFDYFQMQEKLQEEAVKTVGINTMSSALPDPGQAVRNNLMAQESTQKMIKKGIYNFAQGEVEAARQEIALMKQIYPESYLKETDKKTGEKKFKSIKIEGQKLTPVYEGEEENKKLVSIESEESNKSTYFELKGEYFDLTGDVDIELDISSFPLISQALKLSKVQEAIAALLPFWQDPKLLMGPGANELVKSYIRELGVSHTEQILEQFKDVGDTESIEDAQYQTEKMLEGQIIPGVPGESDAHKMVHLTAIMDLMAELSDPAIDEVTKMQVQQVAKILFDHVSVDDAPKQAALGVAEQQMQALQPPPPPQMPPPQQMGGPQGMPPEMMMDPAMMGTPQGMELGPQAVMPTM